MYLVRHFLDEKNNKTVGALRFSEKAVDYAFGNIIHPGDLKPVCPCTFEQTVRA